MKALTANLYVFEQSWPRNFFFSHLHVAWPSSLSPGWWFDRKRQVYICAFSSLVITLEQLLPDSNQLNLSSAERGVSQTTVMLHLILCYGLEQNMDFSEMCIFGGCGKEKRNRRKTDILLGKGVVKFTLKKLPTKLCLYFLFKWWFRGRRDLFYLFFAAFVLSYEFWYLHQANWKARKNQIQSEKLS